MSYVDVLCTDRSVLRGCDGPKREGDLVRLGRNAGTLYEIAAIRGETAWIREPGTFRGDALVPLARLARAG